MIDRNFGLSFFLVQNKLYYLFATLCTNEGHIEEYIEPHMFSTGNPYPVNQVNPIPMISRSVAWSGMWLFFPQRKIKTQTFRAIFGRTPSRG